MMPYYHDPYYHHHYHYSSYQSYHILFRVAWLSMRPNESCSMHMTSLRTQRLINIDVISIIGFV